MIKFDDLRARKLVQLARERFDYELSDAELKVLCDSASSGEVPVPDMKAPRPEIRPELIRWLATDPETASQIDPKGIRVYGVTLPGKLDLEGSCISVRLDFRGCTVNGDVNLEQAETRDILFWQSSVEEGWGFRADTIDLHGLLQLIESRFSGGINLGGARIKGDLDCSGAKITMNEGNALFADGAEVGGDVFLRGGFESSGTLRLPGAKIKGDLDCSGAKLAVKEGNALFADGAEVEGDVFFRGGFQSSGRISLRGSQVGGDVKFFGARVAFVDCTNLTTSGDFYWLGIETSITTALDLRGAEVKNLRDDEKSWPLEGRGNLFLNDLTFEELNLYNRPTEQEVLKGDLPEPLHPPAGEGTRMRIRWLLRQPDDERFKPRPWLQLSKYLEARGRHGEAKHVLYVQKNLQAHKRWPRRLSLVRCFAIAFARLEESPIRIMYTITFAVALGWLVFDYAASNRALAPTEVEAYKAFTNKSPQCLPATYPKLNPFIYTLENAVPLAKLGEDEKWAPDPHYASKVWFTGYWFLMWFRWLLIVSGWFQAAVLGAVFLGRFKE